MVRELAYRLRVPLFNRQKPELYFRHAFVTRAGDEVIRLDVLEIDVASLHEWSLRFPGALSPPKLWTQRRPSPAGQSCDCPSVQSYRMRGYFQNAWLFRLSRGKRFLAQAHNLQGQVAGLASVLRHF